MGETLVEATQGGSVSSLDDSPADPPNPSQPVTWGAGSAVRPKKQPLPGWLWAVIAVTILLIAGIVNFAYERELTSSSPRPPGAFSSPPTTTATDKQFTMAEQQAIRQAVSYLEYTAFSRSGLIEQLEYEGFSKDDATVAVDSLAVDWNEQAALNAASYLDYSGFSRQGLIDQLKYEGFTTEQATYGVDQVGL